MIVRGSEMMAIVLAALERGQRVRLTANGCSMTPFIRSGDIVELQPAPAGPQIADIVLARSAEGYYVIHRISHVQGDNVWLRGDAQEQRSGPFPRQAVLGKAVAAGREGKMRFLDRGLWRLAGRIWLAIHPLGTQTWGLVGLARRGCGWLLRRMSRAA